MQQLAIFPRYNSSESSFFLNVYLDVLCLLQCFPLSTIINPDFENIPVFLSPSNEILKLTAHASIQVFFSCNLPVIHLAVTEVSNRKQWNPYLVIVFLLINWFSNHFGQWLWITYIWKKNLEKILQTGKSVIRRFRTFQKVFHRSFRRLHRLLGQFHWDFNGNYRSVPRAFRASASFRSFQWGFGGLLMLSDSRGLGRGVLKAFQCVSEGFRWVDGTTQAVRLVPWDLRDIFRSDSRLFYAFRKDLEEFQWAAQALRSVSLRF